MNRLTRSGEILLWIFLFFTVTTVICQSEVVAFVGDDVLLPCIYSEPLSRPVSVFWRHKDDGVVLDILDGVPQYKPKGRVSSFPELYRKGNFSIVLMSVQLLDRGPYECHIPSEEFEQHVSLSVSSLYDS